MMKSTVLRLIVPAVAAGLVLGACSSSSSPNASGSSPSSASGGGNASGGGSGGDSGGSSGAKSLCAAVSAEKMGNLLGENVTGSKELSASERFRSGSQLPACKWLGQPVAGAEFKLVDAEQIDCSQADGLFNDPVANRQELSGVGDKAAFRPDALPNDKVIDTFSRKGNTCLFVRIYKGTDQATAKDLTNALLGS